MRKFFRWCVMLVLIVMASIRASDAFAAVGI